MKDDIKKKKVIFVCKIVLIGIVVLSLIIGIGALAVYKGAQAKRTKSITKQVLPTVKEIEYKYTYAGLDQLTFLTTKRASNELKTEFETYVISSFTYTTFTTVTVEEPDSKENGQYQFYMVLDNTEASVIEGKYDVTAKKYTFGFYENRNVEKDPTVVNTETPSTTENQSTGSADPNVPDGTATPVVENTTSIAISQEENIKSVVSTEQTEALHTELLQFLLSESEFRRQLTVASDSVVTTEELISFRLLFDTKRTDNKNITVGLNKITNTYTFIVE